MMYYKRYSENKIQVLKEALNDAMGMEPRHLILCIHTKKQLDNTDITDALPAELVRDLKRNNRGLYRNSDMYLLTEQITPCVQGGLAIAAFIDVNKLLPRIKCHAPNAIIYIPWMQNELCSYCSKHTQARELP